MKYGIWWIVEKGNGIYHAVQAKKSFGPSSGLSFAKLYMNVYISTVGSATPRINRGWPPIIECIIPHNAVEARV
uniref:Boron transporter n=1 Tax=Solanum tuberosum TaxID=4113 RepID=M1BIP0_SOLTU